MKRNISKFIISCIVLISALSVLTFAYSNEPKTANDEVINTIKLLEIANGDQHGNMNFDKEVTRAEFIKMVINASSAKETAAGIKLNVSLFPDVKNSFWGAGYISIAINNGLINGYVDGTFKPNNTVTLEEAATIVLRLLGYTNSDLTGSYPTAQLQKYDSLELDENISAERGDKLTREQCMILLYNTLSTKTKQGQIYCTTIGYSANSEGKLDYSELLENKLDGPILVSDPDMVFENTSFCKNEKTVYFLNNSKATDTVIKEKDVVYYSDIINTVYIYRKTATGILDSVNSGNVTLSGKMYSISTSAAKDKLSFGGSFYGDKAFVTLILGINDTVVDVENGDISKLGENDSNSSLLSMISSTLSKPIYLETVQDAASWQEKIPFPVSDATIHVNGKENNNISVQKNDVIYHSKAFNSIWIFRKTASGTIESISSPTSPTAVTVSGKSYSIVSSDAAYDLSVFGCYDVGDRITLILGINDECVAIANTSDVSGVLYGVITATGEKTYIDKNGEEYTADYITVTDTTNTVYTYEYKNTSFSVGTPVKVAFSDTVSISHIPSKIGKGTAAELSNAFKNGLFSEDCEIIDTNGKDTIKVSVNRISGTSIDPEHFIYTNSVLYYEFDSNGNICKLILKNFTGDLDEYGVVTETAKGLIRYKTDKSEKTLSSQETTCSVGAARFRKESGTISTATALSGTVENIDSFTSAAVYDSNGNEYKCADNVKVFIKNAGIYTYADISDINTQNYTLTAYFDKSPSYGGRIRVIIAARKV